MSEKPTDKPEEFEQAFEPPDYTEAAHAVAAQIVASFANLEDSAEITAEFVDDVSEAIHSVAEKAGPVVNMIAEGIARAELSERLAKRLPLWLADLLAWHLPACLVPGVSLDVVVYATMTEIDGSEVVDPAD